MAIDINTDYTSGVSNNLGKALVVYDKFHVTQDMVEACHQVPTAERRFYAGKLGQLGWARCTWRKNRQNSTEKEALKWESMALERFQIGMACEIRQVLQII